MEMKNLKRAGEIAAEYGMLETARKCLSDATVKITVQSESGETHLPDSMKMHVLNAVNLEINTLRDEIRKL